MPRPAWFPILCRAAAACWLAAPVASAAPFKPANDSQVLERSLEAGRDARLRELQQALRAQPGNLALALETARRAVELGRREGDPRFFGKAESALQPWSQLAEPPEAVRVLRAVLWQTDHRFAAALGELDAVLRANPDDAQARLTRSAVLLVLGRPAEAQQACSGLSASAGRLVAVTCSATAASLAGKLLQGRTILGAAVAQAGSAKPAVRAWALTALAEMAERAGDLPDAEARYRAALEAAPGDAYALAAYADFLLERGRAAEVLPMLEKRTRADNLLLRLAIAEKQDGRPEAAAHGAMLRERFDEARLRGEAVHQREEARFQLELEGNARRALVLAQEDFAVQREPADLLLLLRAAAAAADTTAARPALEQVERTALEDVRLQPLLARARGGLR